MKILKNGLVYTAWILYILPLYTVQLGVLATPTEHIRGRGMRMLAELMEPFNNLQRQKDGVLDSILGLRCADSTVCHVKQLEGGSVISHLLAAEAVSERDISLVIDGPVYSAGVILADRARKNTCITERASFHFHQAFKADRKTNSDGSVDWVASNYSTPPHSRDIHTWVIQNGGYPRAHRKEDFLHMPFEQAKRYWPVCEETPTLPEVTATPTASLR